MYYFSFNIYIQNTECYLSVTVSYTWTTTNNTGYDYGVYVYSNDINNIILPTVSSKNVTSTLTINTDNGFVKIDTKLIVLIELCI